jgi:phosphomannomutase
MQKGKFDLGIVVDPDVDRLALLTEDGEPFGEEYTLVAVADYVLKNSPGNTVSNLSSTKALKELTIKKGGTYNAAAVGEVNVVKKNERKQRNYRWGRQWWCDLSKASLRSGCVGRNRFVSQPFGKIRQNSFSA